MLGFMNGGRKEIKYNSQYIVKRIEQNRHWSAHGRYRDYKASKREVVQLMSINVRYMSIYFNSN